MGGVATIPEIIFYEVDDDKFWLWFWLWLVLLLFELLIFIIIFFIFEQIVIGESFIAKFYKYPK